MELTLTWVLVIFVVGYALHRNTSVRIALGAGLVLGALLAAGYWGDVVHTLDGVFDSFT